MTCHSGTERETQAYEKSRREEFHYSGSRWGSKRISRKGCYLGYGIKKEWLEANRGSRDEDVRRGMQGGERGLTPFRRSVDIGQCLSTGYAKVYGLLQDIWAVCKTKGSYTENFCRKRACKNTGKVE